MKTLYGKYILFQNFLRRVKWKKSELDVLEPILVLGNCICHPLFSFQYHPPQADSIGGAGVMDSSELIKG